jgi:hypothetical protein
MGRVELSRGGREHTDVLRTGVDGGLARNVYDAVLLLEVIGRAKRRAINCLIGCAGEDDAGARGSDGISPVALCWDPIVSLAARQFPRSHQLVILDQGKRPKERITCGAPFARAP